jgi:hypothetical protein
MAAAGVGTLPPKGERGHPAANPPTNLICAGEQSLRWRQSDPLCRLGILRLAMLKQLDCQLLKAIMRHEKARPSHKSQGPRWQGA